MIEKLDGIFETVNFKEHTKIRLYVNDEYENYPPHWHAPMEIIMPLEGPYTVDCAGHKFKLREGDIIFIFPCQLHTLTSTPVGKRIIFQPDVQILQQIKEINAIMSLMAPVQLVTQSNSPSTYGQISSLLLEIVDEYQSSAPLSETAIYARLLNILTIMGRNFTEANVNQFDVTADKRQEYTEIFVNICDYISAHHSDNISLEQMAEKAGFSKYHFSRLFKQFSGQTFYQFLSQKRIEHAEMLLISNEYSITDVANESGFDSLSSFIRMFKLQKNMTPTEFRKMYVYGQPGEWKHRK